MELFSADEAKLLTETMKNNKQLDDLVKKVSAEIKKRAMDGGSRLFFEDKDWHNGYGKTYKLASEKLVSSGYSVKSHIEQFAPNGGRPDDFYGVLIEW
jgi:hypothetical protein